MSSVFLDFASVSDGDLDTARLDASLPDLVYHDMCAQQMLHERIRHARIVLTNKLRLDAEAMRAAPQLELVCLAATGTDNVDLRYARDHGIAVCNIRGYCTASVAQHVFALILALNQHLSGYQKLLREGAWADSPQFCLLGYRLNELDGKTLGILGMGELGSAVARLGEAFGMRVLAAARPGQDPPAAGRVPLSALLATADVLSLHCPLTPQTRGLIGSAELRQMKPGALLINTARGALVDAAALAEALRSGGIAGAGIDVLAQEPPVDGSPLLADDVPNLIVTPHIAWAAVEARQRALDAMADNVIAYQRGERLNRVV